jgi:hypothetical protein
LVRAQDTTPSKVIQHSGAIRPSRIDPSHPAIILIWHINGLSQSERDPPPSSATGCAERRYPAMWWRQDDIPKTAEARDAEIASLIRRRDRMLERAPMSAISGQLVRGLILLLILMSSAQGIVAHDQFVDAWVVYRVCGVLCLIVLYNSLRFPAMSDRWAMSRLVGYEGDSPQDLQNRIDRIRARSRRMVERNQTAKDSNRRA